MTDQPTNGSADDLTGTLLAEVLPPGDAFWGNVDRELRSPQSSSDLGRSSASQDITFHPAMPTTKRSRRWLPVGIAAAIAMITVGFFAVQAVSQSSEDFVDDPFDIPRDERPGPTANLDHWHAAYGVWDCTANEGDGAWVEPFESTRDDYGIHSHGQGLIYIHPFVDEAALDNATFARFAESMVIDVTDDRLVLDDGTVLAEGAVCNGQPAELRLLRWEYDLQLRNNEALEPLVVTENFGAERFYNDREVWVLAFAPVDAQIPMLPFERFRQLDLWLNGSAPLPQPNAEDRVDLAREIPIADAYMASIPGARRDPLAIDLYELRREANHATTGPPAVPETIDHISTLHAGGLRSVDIFRYSTDQDQDCIATFGTRFGWPGGDTTCFEPSDATEIVLVTSVDFSPLQPSTALNAVGITNPPSDAEWIIVFTGEGERIAAPVLDGFAYAEWQPSIGKATRVQLLNGTLDQVWTSTDV